MNSITTHKGIVVIITIALQLCFAHNNDAFAQLPLDAEGWTIFTPSADSRIVYVSASGNDATAQFYLPNDPAVGSDPFNPEGPINAYQTIAAAMLQMRPQNPDWMLLNRGDTFYESLSDNLQLQSGRSSTEVKLFSAYGTGERPLLNTGIENGFNLSWTSSLVETTTDNIAIAHIDFYAHTRDPQNPEFILTEGGAQGGGNGFRIVKSGSNMLIEGCRFSHYANNAIQVSPGATNRLVNVKLRRNVIAHNYRNIATEAHCQGIYTGPEVDSLLMEDNIFWHNGWSEDPLISSTGNGAPATVFNRNAYLNRGEDDLVVRGNIFAESASEGVQQRSGGLAEDNLCLKNSIGILFGQWQAIWPSEAVGGIVRNNVCLDAHDIADSFRGGGIQFEQVDGVLMYDNIIAHQREGSGNINGISLAANFLNVTIEDNVVYNWSRPEWPDINDTRATALNIASVSVPANIIIRNNQFQQPQLGFTASSAGASPPGVSFLNNTYYSSSPNPPTLWSNGWFQVGNSVTSDQWATQMNDSTAILQEIDYVDPARTIETYMTAQGGTPTLTAFMEEAVQQRKDYWRTEYTSYAVNCYIREGFQTTDTLLTCEMFGSMIGGCINSMACNFDPEANTDDGSCLFIADACGVCGGSGTIAGCMDNTACNFNSLADCDDGSCILPDGCMDSEAVNFNSVATCDDGSCIYAGCTYSQACNYMPIATLDDGSCEFLTCVTMGCTYVNANNYDSTANYDDGSCLFDETSSGCPEDLNADGIVNTQDLLLFLGGIGNICE